MTFRVSKTIVGLALVLTMASVGGATASASYVDSFDPTIETAAITPLSMQYFCAQNRNECRGGGSAQVTMTPNLMAVLKQVNVHVNNAIRPQADVTDAWSLNPTAGDCEDYALSKRSMLIRNGVSASSLRIAYTHTRSGEPHAVLVVRTNDGDYVLDNLNSSVKTLRASGYTIRSMSSPNPAQWTAG